jgi:uroporphyrinogen-III decarboxylase
MSTLTTRQRLNRAISCQEVDHVPCSFMSFTALRRRFHEDLYQLALAEKAMGLDAFLFIPSAGRPLRPDHPELRGLPVHFHPQVQTVEWAESSPGEAAVLHKEYHTPAGMLTTQVRTSDDWPHGEHIPFVDDYQVPRAIKPLVTCAQDLEALQFLLQPPTAEDAAAYLAEAERARAFVQQHDLLLAGGWGVGMDIANWLCGVQSLVLLCMDNEPLVAELLGMIAAWNRQRMELVLAGGVDLYIRRAWYEGCDFITPRFYRRVVLPLLQQETALAHEHGARFGYICSSGLGPMLDLFLEAGIDVLIGADPVQGRLVDLAKMRSRLGERMCVWGGVSGAITVEMGSEDEVRQGVRQALQALGKQGTILSPVDNLTIDAPQTWQNIEIFLDEWRRSW